MNEDAEQLIQSALTAMQRAAAEFPTCTLDWLLAFTQDTGPQLKAFARIVDEAAHACAARMFDGEKRVTVAGVEWMRSRGGPSRTGWDSEALLSAVLDSRLVDPESGEVEVESPLAKVLHVWHLPAPRVTALRERGIDGDKFCHVLWEEQRPWKVTPTAKLGAAK